VRLRALEAGTSTNNYSRSNDTAPEKAAFCCSRITQQYSLTVHRTPDADGKATNEILSADFLFAAEGIKIG